MSSTLIHVSLPEAILWLADQYSKMENKTSSVWKKIGKIFNPLKSPVVYFLIFFLILPPVLYGAMRPNFETGEAAGITIPYADFTRPTNGETIQKGVSTAVSVKYSTDGCDARLRVLVDGHAQVNKLVITTTRPKYESFNWTFNTKGSHVLRTQLYTEAQPNQTSVCNFSVGQTITVNVVAPTVTVAWRNPSNQSVVSGKVGMKWWVSGPAPDELQDLDYRITLSERAGISGAKSMQSVLGTVSLGTGTLSDVCDPAGDIGLWVCSHPSKWDTTNHANGVYNLKIILESPDPSINLVEAEDTIQVTINNQNQKPVCDSITVTPSSINSGETVRIVARGSDPDGGALVSGQISYGNSSESKVLNAVDNRIAVNYSGYKVRSGTKTFTVTARFKDNEGEWSEYGTCTRTVKVTAPDDENTCPYISSTPLTSAKVGSTYSYTLKSADPDGGDTVIKRAITKPGWTSFDAATGVLSGSPRVQHVGIYSVILEIVTQDGRCKDTQAFSILVYKPTVGDGDDDGGEVSPGTSVAPTVTIIYPNEEVKFFCDSSTVRWTVSDDGEIVKTWVEYSTDLENWTKASDDLGGDITEYDWDVCDLDPGTYYVRVWAQDDDGIANAGLSEPFEIINPSEALSGPEIINPTPQPESEVTDLTPLISADFQTYDSEVDTATFELTVDDGDVTGSATVNVDEFSYEPSTELSLGTHTVTAKISDKEGREAERTWTFTIVEEEKDTISFLGMELPRWWVSLSALVCGILALLLLIILAIMKLIALGKKDEEDESQTPPEDTGIGSSWEPGSPQGDAPPPPPPANGTSPGQGPGVPPVDGGTADYNQV